MYPHQSSGLGRGIQQLTHKLFLRQMTSVINITLVAWTIFSFNKNNCGRRTQKQSQKQWCMLFDEKKLCTTQLCCTIILYKRSKKYDFMQRETKVVVFQGGVECPVLVKFSLYDTKPVHFVYVADEKLVCNIN